MMFCLILQLLSLNLESVISQGIVSLSVKQKLIDDTLDQSYEIALGVGAFGRCLVLFPITPFIGLVLHIENILIILNI